MRAWFPVPHFAVNTQYDIHSNGQLLHVHHCESRRIVTTALDSAMYEDILKDRDLFKGTMSTLEHTVYRDLAERGYGSEPFEPGNAHHEEIKALCYLSGYHLVEHMPAGAETRGDAWIYLVPLAGGVADKMPPKCLALPLEFWRQLLIRKLDKHVANKQAVI
jgi:hypothetical protein